MPQRINLEKKNDCPFISLNESLIGDSVIPVDAADIEIEMEDGRFCRFFVRVGVKNGRPFCEVSTNTADSTTRKSVTGIKRKRGD